MDKGQGGHLNRVMVTRRCHKGADQISKWLHNGRVYDYVVRQYICSRRPRCCSTSFSGRFLGPDPRPCSQCRSCSSSLDGGRVTSRNLRTSMFPLVSTSQVAFDTSIRGTRSTETPRQPHHDNWVYGTRRCLRERSSHLRLPPSRHSHEFDGRSGRHLCPRAE